MTTEPLIRRVNFRDKANLVAAHIGDRDFHRPWCAPFTDDEGFDDWWSSVVAGPKVSFVAFDAEDRLVGIVNLSEIVFKSFRSAYLGYYGMRESCGRGLMTEAVRAVAQIAFGDLGLHRLEANIQAENVRSTHLVERLGFRREREGLRRGIWRSMARGEITSAGRYWPTKAESSAVHGSP